MHAGLVLIGLQQLSIIATPPARRQPIRTATPFRPDLVRAALLREQARGGQSFVVVLGSRTWRACSRQLRRRSSPNSPSWRRTARCRRHRSTRDGVRQRRGRRDVPPTSSRPGSTCRAPTRW
ncbi:hypothetical protein AB5I41_12450 [Sphingomonas sp. MMS24-JH45]